MCAICDELDHIRYKCDKKWRYTPHSKKWGYACPRIYDAYPVCVLLVVVDGVNRSRLQRSQVGAWRPESELSRSTGTAGSPSDIHTDGAALGHSHGRHGSVRLHCRRARHDETSSANAPRLPSQPWRAVGHSARPVSRRLLRRTGFRHSSSQTRRGENHNNSNDCVTIIL